MSNPYPNLSTADDEDPDLKEAIRLSLMDNSSSSTTPKPTNKPSSSTSSSYGTVNNGQIVVIDSDDEGTSNDNNNKSNKNNKQNNSNIINLTQNNSSSSSKRQASTSSSSSTPRPPPSQTSQTSQSSIFGLDRRGMERERLERLKRAAPPPDNSGSERPSKSQKSNDRAHGAIPSQNLFSDFPTRPISVQGIGSKSGPQYLNGVVKRTYIQGGNRTGADITLDEVLQKDSLEVAVLSSFQWHLDWLLPKLNVGNTYLVLVMQGKTEEDRKEKEDFFKQFPRTKVCFPPMPGQVSCMHSKLQLLFHNTHTRIAIPTANLVNFDWGEGGIMENMVFIIDLPVLRIGEEFVETQFSRELTAFLRAQGMIDGVFNKLKKTNFARTRNFAFVHSIGGSHSGKAARTTGYPGLANAVKRMGWSVGKEAELDFVTSSVGSLTREFLTNMYKACMGIDGVREKLSAADIDTDSEDESGETVNWNEIADKFRLYFPSRNYVAASKGGLDNGGTICARREWWNKPTFPKEIVRECKSVRQGMLMHNKCIFWRPKLPFATAAGEKFDAWAYVGSGNSSESAWGKLVIDRSSKQPKLNLRNWECGVLMAVKEGNRLGERTKPADMSVFPFVPMVYPSEPNNNPWFFGGF